MSFKIQTILEGKDKKLGKENKKHLNIHQIQSMEYLRWMFKVFSQNIRFIKAHYS
jgi:hypothetical protein